LASPNSSKLSFSQYFANFVLILYVFDLFQAFEIFKVHDMFIAFLLLFFFSFSVKFLFYFECLLTWSIVWNIISMLILIRTVLFFFFFWCFNFFLPFSFLDLLFLLFFVLVLLRTFGTEVIVAFITPLKGFRNIVDCPSGSNEYFTYSTGMWSNIIECTNLNVHFMSIFTVYDAKSLHRLFPDRILPMIFTPPYMSSMYCVFNLRCLIMSCFKSWSQSCRYV